MLRVVHTADWHLGHTLYDYDRSPEHQRFLDWLVLELEQRAVDVLLIAGDVFETANPPVSALRQWYSFLAKATERCPALESRKHPASGGNAPLAPPRPLQCPPARAATEGLPAPSEPRQTPRLRRLRRLGHRLRI